MGENNQHQQHHHHHHHHQQQQQQKTSNIMLATQEATIIDLRQQLERREQQIRTLQAQLNMYKSVINIPTSPSSTTSSTSTSTTTNEHHLHHQLHQHQQQDLAAAANQLLQDTQQQQQQQQQQLLTPNRLTSDQQHLNHQLNHHHQQMNPHHRSSTSGSSGTTNPVVVAAAAAAAAASANNSTSTSTSGSGANVGKQQAQPHDANDNDQHQHQHQQDDDDDEIDVDEDVNDALNTDGLLTSLTDAAISNLSQLAALQEQCQQQQHNRQSPVGSAVAAVSANLDSYHRLTHHQLRHQQQQDAINAVAAALSSSSHTPSPIGSGLSHSHSLSSHASGLHSITPSPTSLIRTPRSINTSSSLLSPSSSPGHLKRQLLPDKVPLLSPSPSSTSSMARNALSTPTSGGSAAASPLMGGKPNNRLNSMQIRHKFGYLGSGRAQFNSPHGFCLGTNQEIVVADTNNHRICIFDRSGIFVSQFGSPGKEEGQLWNPRKVAILQNSPLAAAAASTSKTSQDGPLYVVCDRGAERSRMQLFTKDGAFVKKIGIQYIDIVAGLAITQEGLIIVVDSVSPTVYIISGETGVLNGWFDCSGHMKEPSDIAVKSDIRGGNEYFICDFKGHCVVVFSEQGEYLRKIGHDGLTSYPNGIDISDHGDILVGDSHGNRFHVVVFDSHGNFVSQYECPHVKVSRCCGLKITREGYIVTLAKNNHHVLILNTLFITSVQ